MLNPLGKWNFLLQWEEATCSFSNTHDWGRLEKSVSAGCIGTRAGPKVWVCRSCQLSRCQQCKAGTRWATPAFCRHLGTMYTYGWTRKFHGWLKWHNEIRFNLKNYCITVWHRRPKVLRGLLSGSFHSKFQNFGLLIHSVSWGWGCIL